MRWDEHVAINAIDRAIAEIKRASIDDGKDIADHAPLDAAHVAWAGRLHQALADLKAARADVNQEEDNAFAQGLKNRAVLNIDEAIRLTVAGMREFER
jgi:hypothetical protein